MLMMKFGGTSVRDPEAIRRLARIVRGARGGADADGARIAGPAAAASRASTTGGRTAAVASPGREPQPDARARGPVVVVSALAKVTDRLIAITTHALDGDVGAVAEHVDLLRVRHLETAAMVQDEVRRRALQEALEADLAELGTLTHALAVMRDVSPRLQDAIAATGELLSSRIVAAALDDAGLPATWVDARRVLVTDTDMPAAPLMDETRARCEAILLPLVAAGRIPILGGFIGATVAGVTTTLGRGGSDYSASILGVGVGADEIQIWTDVDGMLSADPRIIAQPRPVPRLSFNEASELAYFGAKVLHPSTITPAVTEDIPVRILNSHRPEVPGTLITADGAAGADGVAAGGADAAPLLTAIACKRDVTVIDIVSTRMLMAHGFLRRLFEVFERHRTAVDVVTTSEVSVSVTIDDRRRLDGIIADLTTFAEVSISDEMALVCAVGERLRTDPSLSARVVGTLDGIALRMVSQAGSRRNITFVLPQGELTEAMTRLHSRFCIADGDARGSRDAQDAPAPEPVSATHAERR